MPKMDDELLYPLLAAYYDEYEHAMAPNWDGGGSVAITEDVLKRAEDLIYKFGSTENLVEVAPGRDGSLSFVWEDEHSYIYLDVGPNDTVHLYSDVIGRPKWEGVSVVNDMRILEQLSGAFRSTAWQLCQMVNVVDDDPPKDLGYIHSDFDPFGLCCWKRLGEI